eukprot:CAMPEP_0178925310 /NCGR_PEP_ID=MMETSP0786-20121207/17832_1 /TAXON_ID=186022 /ORGANISM="Thalassionema frauenfeldii, Strain CCMP 1798" /LENGTH=277 /DNA_ID=CAMNT_0020600159 /DNA_START=155 /DNA_END=985 /DNA_ORIENTATION=+
MEGSDDPYEILGVPRTATNAQIKSAYRKLALKHHPDRQADEASKQRATQIFSKISNAYEILGDENSRREFEMQQQNEQNHHDFFRGFQAQHHFHDPFEIFAHVFGDEFGNSHRSGSRGVSDPFFSSDPFGSFGSMFGSNRDPFDDPFFNHSSFGSSRSNRVERQDPFSQMRRQMQMMQPQGGMGGQSFYSSSSTSSNFGGSNSESVSTTTRMINGRRQTVTERVVVRPDGTTERHVETTGDDDFPEQLPGWFGGASGQLEQRAHAQLPSSSNRRQSR